MNMLRRPSDLSRVNDGDDESAASSKRGGPTVYDKKMNAILRKYTSKDNMKLNKIINKYTHEVQTPAPAREAPETEEREPVDTVPPLDTAELERMSFAEVSSAAPKSVTVADTTEISGVCSGLSNDNSQYSAKSSASSKKSRSKVPIEPVMTVDKVDPVTEPPVVEPPVEAPQVEEAAPAPDSKDDIKSIHSVDITSSMLNAEKMCLSLADSASNERSINGSHSMASKDQAAAAEAPVEEVEADYSSYPNLCDELLNPKPDVVDDPAATAAIKRVSSKVSTTSSKRGFLDKFRIRSSASSQREASKKEIKETLVVETVESELEAGADSTGSIQMKRSESSLSPTKSRFFGGKLFGKNKQTTSEKVEAFVDGCLLPTPDGVVPAIEPTAPTDPESEEALRDKAFESTVRSCCSDKSPLETLDALAETYLMPTPDAEVEVTTSAKDTAPVEPEPVTPDEPAPASGFCIKSPTLDSLDALAEQYLLPTPDGDVATPPVPPQVEIKSVGDSAPVDSETAADEGLEMTVPTSGFCLPKSDTMDAMDALDAFAEKYILPSVDVPPSERASEVVKEEIREEIVAPTPVEKSPSALEALDSFAERYLLPTPDVDEVKSVPTPSPEPPHPQSLPVDEPSTETVSSKSSAPSSPLDALNSLAEAYLLPTPDVAASSDAAEEQAPGEKKGWWKW
jgi:hypothetical protein